ncbi:MAG TPA: acetyl-CoA carboxylase biotin carboxyl carrier protein [Clostridia bacterium]|nr:acetyl-CoA carboxylase biotin carboxyl carrier protein [Clostridia bacterium]
MNQKELKELIEFLIEKDIAEFELERGDVKVRIKRAQEPQYVSAAQAPPPAPISAPPMHAASASAGQSISASAPVAPIVAPAEPEETLHIVKSPIVGTYYEAPSPGSPPFIKVGDQVTAGQPLCIVEAMKLMNEIESDVTGEVVKILVANGQPVEYGQALYAIRPR